MTGTSIIEIKWNAIGKSFMRLCLAFGAGFFVLALLNRFPEFKLLAQNSTWIPKYIGDSLAFAVGMIMIWRISQGRLGEYGVSAIDLFAECVSGDVRRLIK